MRKQKQPGYARDLIHYPANNPVFMAQSWSGLNWVRHHWGGMCLLCDDEPSLYNLSYLRSREVWIFQHSSDISNSLRLGRYAQMAGATKVLIISL